MKKRLPLLLQNISYIFFILFYANAHAIVEIQNASLVDVTPSGFSVVLNVSEPSTSTLNIYPTNSTATEISNQFEISLNPILSGTAGALTEYDQDQNKVSLQALMDANGLIRFQVAGLSPNTTYYYQVVTTGLTNTALSPPTGLSSVTTATENAFIAHGAQLNVTVDEPNASGYLMVATHPALGSGVSAVVGDGAGIDQAVLNLSNLFAIDGAPWIPNGSTTLNINLIRGWNSASSKAVALNFTTDFSVATTYQANIGQVIFPEITLLTPSLKTYITDFTYNLQWSDTADQTNASIELFYDVDNSGNDGTLIINSLSEDPDGLGDIYSWDLSSINDGVYYLYAQINDGVNIVTNYASGALAIDRTGTDSDRDSLPDIWELLYFGSLTQTSRDSDQDGVSDLSEFRNGTDPTISAPNVPINVQVNSSSSQNSLTWDNVINTSQYNVYWSFTPGVNRFNGNLLTTTSSSFLHTNTVNNVAYYYVVTAVNSGGESSESVQVTSKYLISNPANPFDIDNDLVSNYQDNCYSVPNSLQVDTDLDGIGNRCDPDYDNDGIVTNADYTTFTAQLGTTNIEMDFDGDGIVTQSDDIIFQSYLNKAPGPGPFVTGADYSYMRSFWGQVNNILDLDQNGVVDAADYELLKNYFNGL